MTTPDKLTPEEVRNAFHDLHERIDALTNIILQMRDGLTQAAAVPATATAGNTVTFEGSILILGYDDNGEATYKLKGAQYMKYGVRIWPETLPDLRIDPATLKPGPNPLKIKVVALLGENGPRKVISLA